jgi:hypothetical protein
MVHERRLPDTGPGNDRDDVRRMKRSSLGQKNRAILGFSFSDATIPHLNLKRASCLSLLVSRHEEFNSRYIAVP